MSNGEDIKNVDDEIYDCLNLDNPKSFFLFAGAGSGKTRSLVTVLKRFRENNVERLRRDGQKVAIITYTNAACDEIKRRLEFDSAFNVSTIHSFAWELISPYTNDMREFLKDFLRADVADLEEKQSKAKNKSTKTYVDRERKIESKTKRLASLDQVRKFTYNPNGDNIGRDSLNHSEVIQMAAFFIMNKSLMQNILTRKYPILLVDESQDTKKELVEALFNVQDKLSAKFSLGMFGDTMQRIYLDGKENLGENIPTTWVKPRKAENYRCPRRVVDLINRIRRDVDGQQQVARKQSEGIVRLFVVGTNQAIDRLEVESNVASQMLSITGDQSWTPQKSDFKILTLEHHMAAKRGGFSSFFDPLYEVDKLRTGLLDGSLSTVSLFVNQVLPLVSAFRNQDKFVIAKVVRQYSPLLNSKNLKSIKNQEDEVKKANQAVSRLLDLWKNDADPKLCDVLKEIYSGGLFQIPDVLIPIVERLNSTASPHDEEDNDSAKDEVIEALDGALNCTFSIFEKYVQYISDTSRFGTHQGVKGLEFPRVMVILDDEDARGFLFNYAKLFGAEEPSETDIRNQQEGKETSIDRTRRLFYVTCSRAEESLAIVAYTTDPQKVKDFAISQQWFSEEEIIML